MDRSNTYAPPEGWMEFCGTLIRVSTVSGLLVRRDQVRGQCRRQECRRTVRLDLEQLVRRGFGAISARQAAQLLRCGDLTGCNLTFELRRGRSLVLRDLTGKPHVKIRFHCKSCGHHHSSDPEQVMRAAATKANAIGKPLDTVDQLREAPMAPCPKCKHNAWRVEVMWPNVRSAGFRVAEEKRLEALARENRR
jgi:DNA-directed RNA polymerase subunit M/transcription elongation factor TFIIS